MESPNDAELVAACLEGHEDAWAQLVERHADLVHAIGRRCGLDDAAAADLVQEVFLALLRSLRRLRARDRLAGWIAQTARRAAWRLTKRGRARHEREGEVARPDEAPSRLPDEQLTEEEDTHCVRQAYGRIGERCRRLLDLLFVDDDRPSYAEIGEALGMAVGSIGPTRKRCLEQLENELRAVGFVR